MSKKPLAKLVRLIRENNETACLEFIRRYSGMFKNISELFNYHYGCVLSAAFEVVYTKDIESFGQLYSKTKKLVYKEVMGFSEGSEIIMLSQDEYVNLIYDLDIGELIEQKDLVRFIKEMLSQEDMRTLYDIVNYTNDKLMNRWALSREGVKKKKYRYIQELRKKLKKFVHF